MGIVSAEIWQDVDDSAGVVLKRIAYYTDPNYEAFDASEELLNGDPGECVPGVGMAGVLWDMMAQKGAPVEWRLLSGIAADEDIPDDPRIDAAAKAFGHVGAQYLEGRQPYASMWSANEAEAKAPTLRMHRPFTSTVINTTTRQGDRQRFGDTKCTTRSLSFECHSNALRGHMWSLL